MTTTVPSFCTIIAGPNGSGKSTIYELLRPIGEYVNADLIARNLSPTSPSSASVKAGRAVLMRLKELMSLRQSFVYETTLGSRQSIEIMRKCRELGYEVGLVFVCVRSDDACILRIKERVERGGHHIDDVTVRRRFVSSLLNLSPALSLAHNAIIYDNSEIASKILAIVSGSHLDQSDLDERVPVQARIGEALATALGLTISDVML
ncbi:zeta toxin family protein [Oryzibacter oryziterrae]|uniref:zeta toxin family protein n=1 Tax=Oryzibacter oryziterrae TaxID=2766474 RepID=UPI001F027C37|nr:zeta toxin family protein [Oryzibacter oryziterrae]